MSKPPTPNTGATKPTRANPDDPKPKSEDPKPKEEKPMAEPTSGSHGNMQIETEGFGRFEYSNGTIYEGQWKIVGNNTKVKHGEGVLTHAGTTAHEKGNEQYSGSWVEDKMEGVGTYKYTSGAIYTGEWKDGKHHGRGVYEFPDGCIYDGEWKQHRMHGEGCFIDREGNRWDGEFVEGVFQSKMQKALKMEKMLKKKEEDIKNKVLSFFGKFEQTFATSDKKTFKENLSQFFAIQDEIKLYVQEPYPKYEEKKPEEWNQAISLIKNYTTINILRHNMNAKVLEPNSILSSQFSGLGQIVEFTKKVDEKTLKLALCHTHENNWVIVFFSDKN